MGIFKFSGELLLIYLVYKIIFELILPAAQITRKAKQMMNDVNQQPQMHNQQNTSTSSTKSSEKSNHDDEYIDYEEVK